MRVLQTMWRWLLRALRFGFIVLLVIIPVPVAALFARPGKKDRRAVPTQTMRKE